MITPQNQLPDADPLTPHADQLVSIFATVFLPGIIQV